VELRVLEQDLSVLVVQLGEHEHVLQGPLAHEVARVGDNGHEHLHCRLEGDVVIVVNHDRLGKANWTALQSPFEATRVQVLQLLG
jgi:hypothetical protein